MNADSSKRLVFLADSFGLPAPPHQSLLRNRRECRKDANLDRSLGLCAGLYRAQATRHGNYSTKSYRVLSLTLFEKTPILQTIQSIDSLPDLLPSGSQLTLVNLKPEEPKKET